MAPEQANGRSGAIGPGVDIYALGAILYELLTGRSPFRAESAAATLQQVLTEEPVLVEGVAGLVLACGASPAGELLETLEAAGLPAVGIGDCLAPRTVEEAVLDGLVAASAI